jgi:formylglycine-generating enzyme required for sulfatase activity
MEFVLADMESKVVKPEQKPEQKPQQPAKEGLVAATRFDSAEPVKVDLGEGVELEVVWIRPGEFRMGSPDKEAERQGNETQHKVRITKGFWIGKYEVTQAQWERLMGSNPSYFKQVGKDAPVEQISWDDCQEFIKKLNAQAKDQLSKSGNGVFRLPTEAEWEYACRAGTKTRFCSGDAESDLDAVGWYKKNGAGTTHPVGLKKANARGLYDMHGNVWEWCQDWYGDYASGDAKDPEGPASGSARVIRGGSWDNAGYCSRSAYRSGDAPGTRSRIFGLRIVCVSR